MPNDQSIQEQIAVIQTNQVNTTEAVKHMTQSIEKLVEELKLSTKTADKALDSASSAHHRINELREDVNTKATKEEVKEVKANQKWMITTTISMILLFLATITLLWRMKGGA